MAAFTEQTKAFVVIQLACFYSPTEVRNVLKEEHGIDADTAQIVRYNPLTQAGKSLSADLKKLFGETREAFIKDRQSCAFYHQNFRMRELERLYRCNARNPKLQADLLRQGAEEAGGAYTNKRELSGPDGGRIPLDVFASSLDKIYGGGGPEQPEH